MRKSKNLSKKYKKFKDQARTIKKQSWNEETPPRQINLKRECKLNSPEIFRFQHLSRITEQTTTKNQERDERLSIPVE